MSNPTVSVICPTFNQSWFLGHALDSIAAQTFVDFELVVIDDCSTDDTAAALGRWCQRNARRLKHPPRPYRLPVNQGTAAAINAGVDLASGSLLTWASSDNLMAPGWLERLVRELDAGAGCAYAAFYYLSCTKEAALSLAKMPEPERAHLARTFGRVLHEPYHPARQLAQEACYLGPAHLIRREVWAAHEGRISHDLGGFLRVEENCWKAGLPIVGVDEPLCYYLAHDSRATVVKKHLYDAPLHLAEARARRAKA